MEDTLRHDLRAFLRRVEDFGKLSGGQMKTKYDADAMEGYEWLARQGRALATRMDAEQRGDGR